GRQHAPGRPARVAGTARRRRGLCEQDPGAERAARRGEEGARRWHVRQPGARRAARPRAPLGLRRPRARGPLRPRVPGAVSARDREEQQGDRGHAGSRSEDGQHLPQPGHAQAEPQDQRGPGPLRDRARARALAGRGRLSDATDAPATSFRTPVAGARRLRRTRPRPKLEPPPTVVVLTNYAYDQLRSTCLEAGADEFLDKRTQFDRLPAIVTKLRRPAP